MHARWARFTARRVVAVTAVAVAVTAGGVVATAEATDTAAPIIIGSCATSVSGTPGTPLELSPAAVLSPVVNIVRALDPLDLITPGFKAAFAALPPIPLGVLPTGKGAVSGSQISGAVVSQLSKTPLGAILSLVVSGVQQTLTSMCQVTVDGVNAVVAPVQNGTAAIASASQQVAQQAGIVQQSGGTSGSGTSPGQTGTSGGGGSGTGSTQQGGGGTTSGGGSGLPASNSPVLGGLPAGLGTGGSLFGAGTLLDYGLAESPLARYAGIPFASAGLFDPAPGVKYGGSVPGYSPSYGVLGQDGTQQDDVRTAGHAEAYHPGGTLGNGVGLPMLLAVLMLAGVTAGLVRTWVLRKVRVSAKALGTRC